MVKVNENSTRSKLEKENSEVCCSINADLQKSITKNANIEVDSYHAFPVRSFCFVQAIDISSKARARARAATCSDEKMKNR